MRRTYLWLLVLCLTAAFVVKRSGYAGMGFYPMLPLRHFATAALMVAIFFGPVGRRLTRHIAVFDWKTKQIASITYGLYVLHYPLLAQWSFAQHLPGFVVAAAMMLLLAYFVEKKLPRLLPRAPST